MTAERIEVLRQKARAEAAEREQRIWKASRLANTTPVPGGRGAVAYGETACPRCGVRSGIGCHHRSPGEQDARLTSHLQLRFTGGSA